MNNDRGHAARIFACLTLLAFPAAALPAQAPAERAASAVDRMSSPGAPGCSAGVSRQGSVVFERASGLSDLEHEVANTSRTTFEAGSVSKQFTAAAVLLLVQDGKLRLGDDIRRYLPEMPDFGSTITVDHLLNHMSGLRDWRVLLTIAGRPTGTAVHSNADVLAVSSRQRALNHRPGEEYAYTNSGYNLAAIMVERISGSSLADFSQERIFRPLGMASTQWRDNFRKVVRGRAIAYNRSGDAFVQDMPFENAYGAGGLLTTVGDLLTWNAALDKERLGPMVTRELSRRTKLPNGEQLSYARGLVHEKYRGTDEIGHGGITSGYVAFTARYPQHKLAVAVLCNAGYADPRELAHAVVDGFLPLEAPRGDNAAAVDPVAKPPRQPPGEQAPRERWRPTSTQLVEFVGRYRSDEVGADYVVAADGGRLVMRHQTLPGLTQTLSPTYRDTFVFPGGRIRFSRTEAGSVTRLHLTVSRISDLLFERLDGGGRR